MLRSSGHSSIDSPRPDPARGSFPSQGDTFLHAQAPVFGSTSTSLLRNDDWHPEKHLAPLPEISTLLSNTMPADHGQLPERRLLSTPNQVASAGRDTGGGLSTAHDPEERPTVAEPHAGDNDQFELVESTAPALADGDTKARFQCPLRTCACHLSELAKFRDLWVHCASPDHALALYHQCHYQCEFGCLLGFPDILSRFEHYGEQRCGVGQLSPTKCPETGCDYKVRPSKKQAESQDAKCEVS